MTDAAKIENLSDEDFDSYMDRFSDGERNSSVSRPEDELFAAMRRDPTCVGMNEAGEIIYGYKENL